jgi:hypothetical protein
MPWANQTNERIQTLYRGIVEEKAVNNRDFDQIVKEMLVRAEILKRDFTKRQLVILSLIVTFSYFYGKDSAIIPKLKDFELAGISATKVTGELTKMVEMGVITWIRGKDTNEFSINDPREWKAAYHKKYNDGRSRELFALNLKHAGITLD